MNTMNKQTSGAETAPEAQPNPADATGTGTTGDRIAELEARITALEAEAQANQDAWLRARADGENLRKRAQIDIANAHKYANEGFATALLPVRDALEAALATPNATEEALRSGVELTLRQLVAAFDKHQVREVSALNEKFDPNRHQAMMLVESDQPAQTVVQVLQKGYLIADRVLRPSLVAVARAKADAPDGGAAPG